MPTEPITRVFSVIAIVGAIGNVGVIGSAGGLLGCRVEIGAPGENRESPESNPVMGKIAIYTSMYREVIDRVTPILTQALPAIEVEWLQGGSEKLAMRLDAELETGAPRADLILTSDPLWYGRLAREGHLMPYASLRALAMRRELVDPEGAFVASRVSAMVIAFNERLVPHAEAPRSFAELFSKTWRGRVTAPDPLGSGTTFTTFAFLFDAFGPEILDHVKDARTVMSGGNSSVIARIESGEQQVGMVLLENVLAGRPKGSPVSFVVPEEGAVPIPGPIAILAKTQRPAAARAVYDILLSEAAQRAIVAGSMHSPFDEVTEPSGAPSLDVLLAGKFRWTREFARRSAERSGSLRERLAQTMDGP